jgi:hypothetical protein
MIICEPPTPAREYEFAPDWDFGHRFRQNSAIGLQYWREISKWVRQCSEWKDEDKLVTCANDTIEVNESGNGF